MNFSRQNSYTIPSILSCALLCILSFVIPVASQPLSLRSQFRSGDFPLVRSGNATPIIVSTEDFKVAQIAAADLATDIEKVTGKKPILRTDTKAQIDNAVIIGTLDKSP